MNHDINDILKTGDEQLIKLEKIVTKAIAEEKLITENLVHQPKEILSKGQSISDQVAMFGGSWKFILTAIGIIIAWIVFNSWVLVKGFDPIPYQMLNLAMGIIAGLQAPIIMMSQNRQGSKDRLRADLDYQVNLKNEIALNEVLRRLDVLESERLPLLFAQQNERLDEFRPSSAKANNA